MALRYGSGFAMARERPIERPIERPRELPKERAMERGHRPVIARWAGLDLGNTAAEMGKDGTPAS